MIYTVKITFIDGTMDIRDCHHLSDIVLDNVQSVKIIREEDEAMVYDDIHRVKRKQLVGKPEDSN